MWAKHFVQPWYIVSAQDTTQFCYYPSKATHPLPQAFRVLPCHTGVPSVPQWPLLRAWEFLKVRSQSGHSSKVVPRKMDGMNKETDAPGAQLSHSWGQEGRKQAGRPRSQNWLAAQLGSEHGSPAVATGRSPLSSRHCRAWSQSSRWPCGGMTVPTRKARPGQ